MVEYRHKIEEEVKAMQNEIRKKIQGTNSEGKETGTQINNVDQKEEINIQMEQNEDTRTQKNEESLRNLWDNFKRPNLQIVGVPEGEEEQQDIQNLSEKIMKENFPNLARNKLQGSPGSPRNPKEIGPRKKHTKTHHN